MISLRIPPLKSSAASKPPRPLPGHYQPFRRGRTLQNLKAVPSQDRMVQPGVKRVLGHGVWGLGFETQGLG